MIKQAYYRGLVKAAAQGSPSSAAHNEFPLQWFLNNGYTEEQYNKYKGVGSQLSPGSRRGLIDMRIKADRLNKAYEDKYGDDVPNKISGTFSNGKLTHINGVALDTPRSVQPPQSAQPKHQGQAQQATGMGWAPARQPVYTRNKQVRKATPAQPRPQAPAAGPNTQIRHRGYTWTPFVNGAAARKYYGGNVIGTKINGQTYYRPFNAEGSTSTGSYARSTRNAQRPGKRVVVPAYRRVM